MAKTRFTCLFLAIALAAWPQTKPTVDELVSFVKAAIQQKEDDRKVAAAVQNILSCPRSAWNLDSGWTKA